jgi:hypothetical protein
VARTKVRPEGSEWEKVGGDQILKPLLEVRTAELYSNQWEATTELCIER